MLTQCHRTAAHHHGRNRIPDYLLFLSYIWFHQHIYLTGNIPHKPVLLLLILCSYNILIAAIPQSHSLKKFNFSSSGERI